MPGRGSDSQQPLSGVVFELLRAADVRPQRLDSSVKTYVHRAEHRRTRSILLRLALILIDQREVLRAVSIVDIEC